MSRSTDDPPAPARGAPTVADEDDEHTRDALSPRHRAARDALLAASPLPPAAHPATPRSEGMRIGRYQLLEMVGAGGMGLVWGAWDPELERRVALKLVQPTVEAARERMLAEGQSLAKLSHPHVVPIYDVGVVGAQIYLVMEWVRGTTLRAFARTRPGERDLVEAYRQAGEGLAAAHHAGIVHRDFKPDNVIRGDDGRVRVLDFGLARSREPKLEAGLAVGSQRDAGEESSLQLAAASPAEPAGLGDPGGDLEPGAPRVAGTPRYMAPELASDSPASAASDQYAFCVSLAEAMEEGTEGGKVPRWIAAIVARGSSADPAQRFASMDALLAALARDPARRWRRRAAFVAIAAAAGGAFAVGRVRASDPALEPCAGSTAELATAWGPGARGQVLAHLSGLGVLSTGEPERIADELDTYSVRWADEHRR